MTEQTLSWRLSCENTQAVCKKAIDENTLEWYCPVIVSVSLLFGTSVLIILAACLVALVPLKTPRFRFQEHEEDAQAAFPMDTPMTILVSYNMLEVFTKFTPEKFGGKKTTITVAKSEPTSGIELMVKHDSII
ncbi:hypothetical protein N7520_006518 [Penicillium odoratum]|uniref:uncharacterized protein n=1 Tax=Penicillium odoratum TaxID=1167516 RepID=UPI0025483E3F|nr:uncharacterized protein N7520_006518 [Penicillium odoratum]KAJ5759362.1 hypothetical protein N7520_006518 [Penicillium odoratum]